MGAIIKPAATKFTFYFCSSIFKGPKPDRQLEAGDWPLFLSKNSSEWLLDETPPSLFVNVPLTEKAIASRPRLIVCCGAQICSTFGPRGQFGNLLLGGSEPELDTIKPPILENFRRRRCRLGNKTEQITSKLENYDPSAGSEWHTQVKIGQAICCSKNDQIFFEILKRLTQMQGRAVGRHFWGYFHLRDVK